MKNHYRIDPESNQRIVGHKGGINDFKFNPFNDDVIATSSDDCTT